MLNKLMASFGVGIAKVNLELDKQQYRIGETVKCKAVIKGGNVDQKVNSLDIDIVMKFNIRGKDFSRVVKTLNVAQNFFVKEKKTVEFPVEHYLPADYPISKGSLSYHLVTKMNIARSSDTGDTDNLVVLPCREMDLVIEAFDILGFKEKIGSGRIERHGQEFTYYPTASFGDQIRELGLKFFSENNSIKLFLELRLTGSNPPSGAVHHTELAIPSELLRVNAVGQIADHIREFIENELKQVSQSGPKPAPDFTSYQQQASGRPGFGGFAGGMVAGLLGAMMFNSLFDFGGNEMAGNETADSDFGGGDDSGGFDFGDFGDDL